MFPRDKGEARDMALLIGYTDGWFPDEDVSWFDIPGLFRFRDPVCHMRYLNAFFWGRYRRLLKGPKVRGPR